MVEGVQLTLIYVHEPTDDSNRDVTVEFFARLQETDGSVARGDVMIVMGNLNARVGNDTEVWEEILGKHGEVACNENWRWLPQFSIQRTVWFQHKKYTSYMVVQG